MAFPHQRRVILQDALRAADVRFVTLNFNDAVEEAGADAQTTFD